MDIVSKWTLTEEEKNKFIEGFTANLPALRMQVGISQEELARVVGVSRQTYSAIERKIRPMSWNTYLSLVMFFDYNQKTHKMLRMLSLFPRDLITRFNDGVDYSVFELSGIFGESAQNIYDQLDDQARQTILSILMMEYARCTQLPSEAVVKSFGGILHTRADRQDRDVTWAIKTIRDEKCSK